MRWKERQDEGRREEKEAGGTDATGAQTDADGGRRTEGERRGEERQQLGYFAATLTEEVTVKYTAVARRAGGLHESETSSSSARREHTYTHPNTHTLRTLRCSILAVPLMKELNRQNLFCLGVQQRAQATTGSEDNEEEEAAAGGEKEEVVYLDDGGRLERMPRRVASRRVARRRRHPLRRKTSPSARLIICFSSFSALLLIDNGWGNEERWGK